jgi:hypothetical protein
MYTSEMSSRNEFIQHGGCSDETYKIGTEPLPQARKLFASISFQHAAAASFAALFCGEIHFAQCHGFGFYANLLT